MRYIGINLQNIRRMALLLIALPLISLGVCMFTLAGFGNDPFTCMNMGLANLAGMSFGAWQLLINSALLVLVFLFARYLVGIATLLNMVLIGFLVDWFLPPLQSLFPGQLPLSARIALMLCGVVVVSLGGSLYTKTKLGVSPYDAAGFILSQKSGWKFQWCRVLTDSVVTTVGFLAGSVVGVGTVITAFFMGPLIALFNVYVCDRLLRMDEFEDFWMSNSLVRGKAGSPRLESDCTSGESRASKPGIVGMEVAPAE